MADDVIRLQGTLPNGNLVRIDLTPYATSLYISEEDLSGFFRYKKVVYCKECKHSEYDEIFDEYWCDGRRVMPNHYCSIGELRDGKDKQ